MLADRAMLDFRVAVRRWLRSPTLAAVGILSLALGIGFSAAVAALGDVLFVRPLGVSEPSHFHKLAFQSSDAQFSYLDWLVLEQMNGAGIPYELTAAASDRTPIGWDGSSRHGNVNLVSDNFYQLAGLRPYFGSWPRPKDLGAVAIGYAFWQAELGGRRDVLGRALRIGKGSFVVTAVAPPSWTGIEVGQRVDAMLPLAAESLTRPSDSRTGTAGLNWVSIFARRRTGSQADESDAVLQSIERRLSEAGSRIALLVADQRFGPLAFRSSASGLSRVRNQSGSMLGTLSMAVALVLALACLNISTLLVARTFDREEELKVRTALGATRFDLGRLLAIDSAILTVTGVVTGTMLTHWFVWIATPSLTTPLDRGITPYLGSGLDVRRLTLAAAIGIACVVVCAAIPMIARRSRVLSCRGNVARPTGSGVTLAGRITLLAMLSAQVAVTLVVVATSTLLVRSFAEVVGQELALDPDGVVSAAVEGPVWHSTINATRSRIDKLVGLARAIPGVEVASASVITPMSGIIMLNRVEVPGGGTLAANQLNASVNRVTRDYLRVVGTKILDGRSFDERDTPQSRKVAIVNKAFGELYFGGQSGVGKILKLSGQDVEVVGVVANGKYMNIRENTMRFAYVLMDQWIGTAPLPIRIGLRASDTEAARGALISAVRRFDPDLSLEFRTLSDDIHVAANPDRLAATIGGVLAVICLGLSALGLYGTFAYLVSRRSREIAIRIAVGANPADIRKLGFRDFGWVASVGTLVGGAGTYHAHRLTESLLFNVTGTDTPSMVVAWSILICVSTVAVARPLGRLLKVDPASELRA